MHDAASITSTPRDADNGRYITLHYITISASKNKLRCYPQQLESLYVFAIKSAYAIKMKRSCHKNLSAYARKKHRNPLEFHNASAPEPSGTSQGICTGTLRNLTKHLLRQNPPEPHKVSAPEPSGTSQVICPGTLQNLTTHLHLDPPRPHQIAAPETSGTSPGTCIKTL